MSENVFIFGVKSRTFAFQHTYFTTLDMFLKMEKKLEFPTTQNQVKPFVMKSKNSLSEEWYQIYWWSSHFPVAIKNYSSFQWWNFGDKNWPKFLLIVGKCLQFWSQISNICFSTHSLHYIGFVFENGEKVGVSHNPKLSETFRNRVKKCFLRRMISDLLVVLALFSSYQKLFALSVMNFRR